MAGSLVLSKGQFNLNGPLLPNDYDEVIGQGSSTILKLQAGAATPRTISLTDKSFVVLRRMRLDGSWVANAILMYFDGIQYCKVEDIQPLSAKYICTMYANNRISTQNDFSRIIMNGTNAVLNGFLLSGSTAPLYPVADNYFQAIRIWLTANAVGTGIDFAKSADTNQFIFTRIGMAFAGQTGVIYNSDAPAAARDVYSNDFYKLIIDMAVPGMTSILVNDTRLAAGQAPISFIQVSFGGANPVLPAWAGANSHAVLGGNSDFMGLPAEANGLASITGAVNSVTFNHGIMTMPSWWTVVPSQIGSGDWCVDLVTATQIRIWFQNQPGGGTWLFKWTAGWHTKY
ncbi:MAG: hypothetical protein PHU23_00175 [Dehalococcoidales bacterium]|nr:hypothetical protein [Dehalococcoidales bacterium]